MTIRSGALLLSLVLSGAFTVTATGQWAWGYEAPFQTGIGEPTVDLAQEMLHLSEEQVTGAEELLKRHQQRFKAHVAEHHAVADQFKDQLQHLPVKSTKALRLELEREETLEDAADGQRALDQQFLDELKSFLSEEQLSYWPRFQQKFNRLRWLGRGGYPMGKIDLIAIVDHILDQAEAEPDKELREALDAYGLLLDEALVDRAKSAISKARRFYRDMEDRYVMYDDGTWTIGSGPQGSGEKFRRGRMHLKGLHERVRDVNRSFHQTITAVLPEELRQPFHEACIERALHGVIELPALPGQEFVEMLLDRDDLTDDQLEYVVASRSEHDYRAGVLHQKILQTHEKLIDARYTGTTAQRKDLEQAVEDAREQRIEAERQLIDRVWTVLSQEQQQEIEKPLVAERQ